jgi:O-acetyl-ADP-ribose deacetylase (regulator of RNase III)
MQLIQQDITKETEGLIIHGVNCQRTMGSGVALAIKTKWPIIYREYMTQGKGRQMLGHLHIIPVGGSLYVGNGYTQEFYGRDGKQYADINAIDLVLHKSFMWCYLNGVQLKSPKIGSQLGGLDWETQVKPLFEKYEEKFGTEAKIFYI